MDKISNRLTVLATALAAGAASGGLVISGLYADAPNWVQQARGTDLATLILAVPVLVAGVVASRRSAAGRAAVAAGLLYLVYNYAIFAFSVAMNPLTAVQIAIFGLALWSLVLSGREIVDGSADMTERLARRTSGGLLIGVTGLFALLWLSQITATSTSGVLPPDLVKAGISTNPVYALDLGFFLPLCAVAGVGLIRRTRAAALAFPMLIWVALMGAGVVGGFLMMAATGDAIAIPVVAMITVLSLVSAALAAVAIVRRETPTSSNARTHPARAGA